jgi:hypothetical protein
MIGQHPHNTSGYQPYTTAQGIRIAWANVGRSSPSHITILQLAWETKVDVVCVQEPFTCLDSKTSTHPGYNLHAPVTN